MTNRIENRDRYSDKGTSQSISSSDKVLYARPYKRTQSAGANIVANDEKSLFNEIGIPELEQLYYSFDRLNFIIKNEIEICFLHYIQSLQA